MSGPEIEDTGFLARLLREYYRFQTGYAQYISTPYGFATNTLLLASLVFAGVSRLYLLLVTFAMVPAAIYLGHLYLKPKRQGARQANIESALASPWTTDFQTPLGVPNLALEIEICESLIAISERVGVEVPLRGSKNLQIVRAIVKRSREFLKGASHSENYAWMLNLEDEQG